MISRSQAMIFQGSGGIALVFVGNWGYAPDQGSSYDSSRRSGPGVKLCFFKSSYDLRADQARSQVIILFAPTLPGVKALGAGAAHMYDLA